MLMQSLESAARAIFHASWQTAVLGLLVLVVCRGFSRIPASVRCGLWMVVLVRLLVPLAPQSSISLFNLARLPEAAAETNSTKPLPARIEPTLAGAELGTEIKDVQALPGGRSPTRSRPS